MHFKEKFRHKISIMSKKGPTYLFMQSIKNEEEIKNKLDTLRENQIVLPKLNILNGLSKYEVPLSIENRQKINPKGKCHNNRVSTSYSVYSSSQTENPEFDKRSIEQIKIKAKSLSKSQYDSEFLTEMLEKHKKLIKMLDKKSKYRTFQR